MLEIINLHAKTEESDVEILKGVSLKVEPGQIHAIMGPNGAGKSTLAKVIAGHPAYEMTEGDILFRGESVLEMDPDERAHLGVFMGFQYPVEIPGVSNRKFLHAAINAKRKKNEEATIDDDAFSSLLAEKMELMNIPADFSTRNVNEGFSGGEKKRNEILQMAMLNPDLAILDETDSGLDIDAMRIVAHGVNTLMDGEKALVMITHYQRLLDYIKPQFVHVMMDGKIVESGGAELALKLEEKGYEWVQEIVTGC